MDVVKEKAINKLKGTQEGMGFWLRRQVFLYVHWGKYPISRLNCLSYCYTNVMAFGCVYTKELMDELYEMAVDVANYVDSMKANDRSPSNIEDIWNEKICPAPKGMLDSPKADSAMDWSYDEACKGEKKFKTDEVKKYLHVDMEVLPQQDSGQSEIITNIRKVKESQITQLSRLRQVMLQSQPGNNCKDKMTITKSQEKNSNNQLEDAGVDSHDKTKSPPPREPLVNSLKMLEHDPTEEAEQTELKVQIVPKNSDVIKPGSFKFLKSQIKTIGKAQSSKLSKAKSGIISNPADSIGKNVEFEEKSISYEKVKPNVKNQEKTSSLMDDNNNLKTKAVKGSQSCRLSEPNNETCHSDTHYVQELKHANILISKSVDDKKRADKKILRSTEYFHSSLESRLNNFTRSKSSYDQNNNTRTIKRSKSVTGSLPMHESRSINVVSKSEVIDENNNMTGGQRSSLVSISQGQQEAQMSSHKKARQKDKRRYFTYMSYTELLNRYWHSRKSVKEKSETRSMSFQPKKFSPEGHKGTDFVSNTSHLPYKNIPSKDSEPWKQKPQDLVTSYSPK